MFVREIKAVPDRIMEEIRKTGVSEDSLEIFLSKGTFKVFKLYDVLTPAANVLKQEMLAAGGDAAVHRYAVNCKVDKTDVVLFGTKRTYEVILEKLKKMPYWDIDVIRERIESLLNIPYTLNSIPLSAGRMLQFGEKTSVMGVVNVTPDSFYPNSRIASVEEGIKKVEEMIKAGVDIIDIGGESTRPGAEPVSVEEESNRVIPLIKAIRERWDIPISIDTYKSEVARKALREGADMVNDISGLRFDPDMIGLVKEKGCPFVIMHIKGTPRNMQNNPYYEDCTREIVEYFQNKIEELIDRGLKKEKMIIDPGIGFGKRVEDNLEILRNIEEFRFFGIPILIGISRKSIIGKILNLPVEERLEGTLALNAYAVSKGANIIRVHDVKETVRVCRMIDALTYSLH
ncbi:MAG: dihydropteroate synthase [Thermotoga sp.]|nr:MAG: dihydropteroate synthase [Thermotoga sp.]